MSATVWVQRERATSEERKVAVRVPRILTAVILDRMTPEVYGVIVAWATDELAKGNPQPSLWLDKFRVANSVNVSSDGFKAAVAAIVAAGKMTQADADIVFAPPG